MSKPDALNLGVIIPAAGASTRLGQSKQLLEIDGEPLLRRTVQRALSLQPAQLIVVTGAQSEAVTRVLAGLPVTAVHHPGWEDGFGSSIAAGARVINPALDAIMVLLCDQWRLTSGDLHALYAAWLSEPGQIVVSTWSSQQGPPVIFPGSMLPALRGLLGDRGARDLVKGHAQKCRFVHLENAAYDLDTPEDLLAVRNTAAD